MARSRSEDGVLLDALPSSNRLKRLTLLIGIPVVAALILLLVLWNTFFKYVRPGEMLVVISKAGEPLSENAVLADDNQKGIQRRVLGEGWHFIMPIVYTTEVWKMDEKGMAIPPGMVGIVKSQGGKPPAEGRVLAEDGERGIQREILLPGTYRLNPYGYIIKQVPMVRIDPGFVGVLRRKLASADGRMGIVKDRILQPGIYPLNTEEYEVIACEVGIGQTSYQYAKDARDNITFQAKDAYSISLDCTIEWEVKPEFWPAWVAKFGTADQEARPEGNNAPRSSKGGSGGAKVRAEAGTEPPLKVGDIRNIERLVIDQHVRKICRDRGLNYGAQDFLEGELREKFQADFRTELDTVCKEDNVVVRSAFIRNIIIPDKFLEQKRLEQLAREMKLTSEALTLTADTAAEVAEAKQTIKLREAKVEAETEKMVATVERETQTIKDVTDAEIERLKDEYAAKIATVDAERKKALGEADAEAKKLKDTAEATLLKMKMDVFGRDGDAYLRYTMAKELNPKMQLRLFQSGPGTLWTNMGNKDVNFMMQLPSAENGKLSTEKHKTEK